ncbi:MAG: phage tail tube protein [Blastopirellula sp. JB062]
MPVHHVSGFQTQLGLGPQHASALATRQFEHFGVELDKQTRLIAPDGMLGRRGPIGDATQVGRYAVGGTISLWPRPDDLTFLLPYVLGAAAEDDTFALAETLPELVATVDRAIQVETYRGLKVDRAIFRSGKGAPLSLDLALQGKTVDAPAAAGTFPDLQATLSAKNPLVHHQAKITIDETEIEVDDLTLTIDNALELEHFHNSLTRVRLPEGPREITLTFETELSDDVLDHLIEPAPRGVTAEIEYANGVDTLRFTFGLLQQAKAPLPIQAKGTVRPRHRFRALADWAAQRPQLVATCTNV